MLPKFLYDKAAKTEEYARGMVTGGTLFEEMGFYYVGPIDGHNLDHLLPVLKNVKDDGDTARCSSMSSRKRARATSLPKKPPTNITALSKFDVITGAQVKAKANAPAYTKVFAKALIKEAEKDEKIVAVTAAMPSGTGLDLFGQKFPNRTFDVGIAEQHARDVLRAGLPPKASSRSLRSIRPSCSALTTRSSMMWRSSACRCALRWTAPGLSAPMGRPMPARSISPIWARCRASS